MKRQSIVAICLSLIALWTLPIPAADFVPSMINHQGVVRVGGEPFTGKAGFRFAIVAPEGLGYMNVWTNDETEIGTDRPPVDAVVLPVEQGLYQVNLGDPEAGMMPIVAELFGKYSTVALRIWFDDGVHGVQLLEPDQPLTSAPFAHVAEYARIAMDSVSIQGQQPSEFSPAGHTHTLSSLSGMVTDAQVPNDITIDHAASADIAISSYMLNGQSNSDFATAAHSHTLSSLTGTLSNDQLPAQITVDQVNYTTPRTQYYAVAEPDWKPRSSLTGYQMVLGNGGVYVTSAGSQMLAAPVHLPHGAVIKSFTVKFYKESGHSADLTVMLRRYTPNSSYTEIAAANTASISGFGSVTTSAATNPYRVINNTNFSYLLTALSDDWGNGKLKIMHVSIEYTLDAAL
jgi:hypothetical protein